MTIKLPQSDTATATGKSPWEKPMVSALEVGEAQSGDSSGPDGGLVS